MGTNPPGQTPLEITIVRATTDLPPPTVTRTITLTTMAVITTPTRMGVRTITLEKGVLVTLLQAVDLGLLLARPVGRVSEVHAPFVGRHS